jgi:single-strand DNA-binding protein
MAKGTLNQVIIVGRLGADPDVRYTTSGTAVAKLNVATVDSVKKNDQWEDLTEWHKVVVWGKSAEFCGQYMTKGSLVSIVGSIRTNQWEDKDGNKRYTTEILARDVQMMGGKSNGDSSAPTQDKPKASGGSKSGGKSTGSKSQGYVDPLDGLDLPTGGPGMDDDIPF